MSGDTPASATLVLGIGNLLWADEGFGVRCVEEFDRLFQAPPDVQVMDGGTMGLVLVPFVRDARQVLVFDACDYGEEPGTLRVIRDGDIPSFLGINTASLHQVGFSDILAAIELMGGGPERITAIAVQAKDMEEWGGGLTDTMARMVAPAVQAGVDELRSWGVEITPRDQRPETSELVGNDMDWAGYERRRPAEV